MTPSQKKTVNDYFYALGLKEVPKSEGKTRLIKATIRYVTNPYFEKVAVFYPMIGNFKICPKNKRKLWNTTPIKNQN